MNEFDLIIIGAGPAGLSAGIYGARANKSVLILDPVVGGGEAGKIAKIENYPGVENIDGLSLLYTMKKQALESGAQFENRAVIKVDCQTKTVYTKKSEFKAKAIILATGCKAQKLGLENERELIGFGISYCATCDGALFKNREVALVGKGKKAESEVEYLSGIASKVYYITTDENYKENKNIQPVLDKIVKLEGNPLEKIILESGKEIRSEVLFVNIGYFPESSLISSQVETDEKGYVITNENMQTSVQGIYAVGDVRKTVLRQVVTATADGAIAGQHAVSKK